MKVITALVVVIAVIVLLGGLPAMGDAITDFRTDYVDDAFIVTTNATASTANVQLTRTLWDNVTTNAAVVSNITADTPALDTYTSGNRNLTIDGLGTNTTRLITVSYKTAGLANYDGADRGIRFLPVAFIIAAIGLVLGAFAYAWFGR